MSDYTPTTKDVRDVYGYAKTFRDFDDWLEQHDKEVAKATEQRIIKLLEDFGTDNDKPLNPFHCDLCLTLTSLIALIKGENK